MTKLRTEDLVVLGLFGALAVGVCLFNCFLVSLIPWFYRRRRGNMQDYDSVSGLPMLGSIFVLCAAALLPPDPWVGAALLVVYHLDGSGLPAFVFAVTRHGL